MKYYKFTALSTALLIISGCASDNTRIVDAPQVSIIAEESTTQPQEIVSTENGQAVIHDEDVPSASAPVQESESTTATSTSATTTAATTVATTTATTTSASTSPVEAEPVEMIDYGAYYVPDEELEFLEQSIFVGDSICMGFSEYGILSSKRVYAKGNLGARSFYNYEFYYNGKKEEIDFAELLKRTQPKYVFFSMGMNDVNMTTREQYCQNYAKIIDQALAESEAEVYICAITPINSTFCTNEWIDSFNEQIKEFITENYTERVHYVDFGVHFENENGELMKELSSGDGIHLAPFAYNMALWEISRTIKANESIESNS